MCDGHILSGTAVDLRSENNRLRAERERLLDVLRPFATSQWRNVHPGQPMREGGFFRPEDVDRAIRTYRDARGW